jgi:hypothetical protein
MMEAISNAQNTKLAWAVLSHLINSSVDSYHKISVYGRVLNPFKTDGAINVTAPHPIQNESEQNNCSIPYSQPRVLLRISAVQVIGNSCGIKLLKSRYVYPMLFQWMLDLNLNSRSGGLKGLIIQKPKIAYSKRNNPHPFNSIFSEF